MDIQGTGQWHVVKRDDPISGHRNVTTIYFTFTPLYHNVNDKTIEAEVIEWINTKIYDAGY